MVTIHTIHNDSGCSNTLSFSDGRPMFSTKRIVKNEKFYPFDTIRELVVNLACQIKAAEFDPEVIVGVARGGLVPATMLSYGLNKRLEVLQAKNGVFEMKSFFELFDKYSYKTILIVDEICDSGKTLDELHSLYEQNYPRSDYFSRVHTAVLVHNTNSKIKPTYSGSSITKTKDGNPWIVFPWE